MRNQDLFVESRWTKRSPAFWAGTGNWLWARQSISWSIEHITSQGISYAVIESFGILFIFCGSLFRRKESGSSIVYDRNKRICICNHWMLCRLLNSSKGWNGQGCGLPRGSQPNLHRKRRSLSLYESLEAGRMGSIASFGRQQASNLECFSCSLVTQLYPRNSAILNHLDLAWMDWRYGSIFISKESSGRLRDLYMNFA